MHWESLRKRVLTWAMRWLESPEDAEDLAQDVLITAYSRLDTFRGEARLDTWIYRIARNEAMSWHRARKAARRSERAFTYHRQANPQPDRCLERMAACQLLERGLERTEVTPVQRRILEFVLLEGLPPVTIAAKMDRPAGTVRSDLSRGLAHLRRGLGVSSPQR